MICKTDWQARYASNGMYAGDWFNATDYNRITENIANLSGIASVIWGSIYAENMPTLNTASLGLPEYFNVIERNLNKIVQKGIERNIVFPFSPKTWEANKPAPTFEDINRWENAIAVIYDYCIQQSKKKTKIGFNMAIRLGGSEF